jgi:hypothetical protein
MGMKTNDNLDDNGRIRPFTEEDFDEVLKYLQTRCPEEELAILQAAGIVDKSGEWVDDSQANPEQGLYALPDEEDYEVWVLHPIEKVPGLTNLILRRVGEGSLRYRVIHQHHVLNSADPEILAEILSQVLPESLRAELRSLNLPSGVWDAAFLSGEIGASRAAKMVEDSISAFNPPDRNEISQTLLVSICQLLALPS